MFREPEGWSEVVVLSPGERVEFTFDAPRWRLAYLRNGEVALEYDGSGSGARRRLAGRIDAYRFRSIEQLRYDFVQEMEDLRR